MENACEGTAHSIYLPSFLLRQAHSPPQYPALDNEVERQTLPLSPFCGSSTITTSGVYVHSKHHFPSVVCLALARRDQRNIPCRHALGQRKAQSSENCFFPAIELQKKQQSLFCECGREDVPGWRFFEKSRNVHESSLRALLSGKILL